MKDLIETKPEIPVKPEEPNNGVPKEVQDIIKRFKGNKKEGLRQLMNLFKVSNKNLK